MRPTSVCVRTHVILHEDLQVFKQASSAQIAKYLQEYKNVKNNISREIPNT